MGTRGRSYLRHRGLRVEHEVPERSLEDPSELGEEVGVVGDGPGRSRVGLVFTLNYPLWRRHN